MKRDMVTRTVLGTKAIAKVVDTQTDEIKSVEVILNGSFTLEEEKGALSKLTKAVVNAINDEHLVLIKVTALEPFNKLYGLKVDKFMELAVELDEKTRRPINAPAEETEAENE